MAVLWAHLSVPPPALSSRRPGMPTAADQVLARGMAKAAAGRYPTCREFAEALREALDLDLHDRAAGAAQAVAAAAPVAAGAATVIRPKPDDGHRGERELPTGDVTLMFSDIEGSTLLLSRLGDRYADALSAQRVIVRAAIAEWPRAGAGDGGRQLLRGVRSSAAARSAAAWRRSGRWPAMTGREAWRCGSGWACIRVSRPGTRTAISAWTCTGRRGSRPRRTAVRWSCPRSRGGWRHLGWPPSCPSVTWVSTGLRTSMRRSASSS